MSPSSTQLPPSLLLFLFVLVSTVEVDSSALDTIATSTSRRLLHQPLYPIQWTPPPPPSDFSDPSPSPAADHSSPFFPSNPATTSTPTSTSTPGTDATVSANVSASLSGSRKKPIVLGVSVAVAASATFLALLIFSAFLLYRRHRSAHELTDSRKLVAGCDDSNGGRRSARLPGRAVASADFLYLGAVEPSSDPGRRRTGDADGSSPCRKLGTERVLEMDYQPSPELQPLPRLTGPPSGRVIAQPPPQRPPSVLSRASSDDDSTFYPPNRSVASATSESPSSPVSRGSLPNISSETKESFTAAVMASGTAPTPPPHPRSRRTSPRMQLADCPNSTSRQPSGPATPPPPSPLAPTAHTFSRMRPPAPPLPLAALDAAWGEEQPREVSAEPAPIGPTSSCRLLKPLPPEVAQFDIPIPPTKFSNGVDDSSQPSVAEGEANSGRMSPPS